MKKQFLASLVAGAFLSLALFSLPAHGAPIKIMCFGDSVTSSQPGHDSYRRALYFDLVNAGFDPVNGFDFVGSQHGVGTPPTTPPDNDFDTDNEGYEGLDSNGGISAASSAAGSFHPDIVLLDIGSNDALGDMSATEGNLESIIEAFRSGNPNVIILMAQSTEETDVSKKDMSAVRKAQATAGKNEKKAGANVIMVNIGGGFSDKKDTYDGIHPNERGEEKIAKKYFSVLKKIL